MQQNAYLLAKIGADTAENAQHSAEILPIGRRVADPLVHRLLLRLLSMELRLPARSERAELLKKQSRREATDAKVVYAARKKRVQVRAREPEFLSASS